MGGKEADDVDKGEEVASVESRDEENVERWSLWLMPLKKSHEMTKKKECKKKRM